MNPEPSLGGDQWLTAALTGGLPAPVTIRWQPVRVGVVGLWEYDNAEFWFADGRLVLRGGNGAGKTKVLELTTLMLLRGETFPAVLDPFGSQHRTMKFNLLPTGDGDDPREPADSGLGYAWVEFGRIDDEGRSVFYTCGMGASARRGTGTSSVTTWHFVTDLRHGKDFSLASGSRVIEQKDLKKLDGIQVPGSATAYRARLATDLFGLDTEAYDNLTELLKQLRKPKLGERLNPAVLAETLRDALPPLATNEIDQLADGWDHLEQLRTAVEETENAAVAVANFVRSGWKPWARTVVRRRADEFASATTKLDDTTRDKNAAEKRLAEQRSKAESARVDLENTTRERKDRDIELRELLESPAYRSARDAAGRVMALKNQITTTSGHRRAADTRTQAATRSVASAQRKVDEATRRVEEAESTVRRGEQQVIKQAGSAGLADAVDRHLPDRDTDALHAALQTRRERFAHLRGLYKSYQLAEKQADLSAQAVNTAQQAVDLAARQETAATTAVEHEVETFRIAVREWADGSTADIPAILLDEWSELVADLTEIDEDSGQAVAASSVIELMRTHLVGIRDAHVDQRIGLQQRRTPLATRHDTAVNKLEEVRARTDEPPPSPATWARRTRPTMDAASGVPLWRCVDPADDLGEDQLARLEAALAASGLLDAWVLPDGTVHSGDGMPLDEIILSAVKADDEPTDSLLSVLRPVAAGGVSEDQVAKLLAGIGWYTGPVPATTPRCWLSAEGDWRVDMLVGRIGVAASASYVGTAAREAARQREIARLEAERAELAEQLAVIDGELGMLEAGLLALRRDEEALPFKRERELHAAVTLLGERIRRHRDRVTELHKRQGDHRDDLTARDTARAELARYAGEHRFDHRDLDGQATAITAFGSTLDRLSADLDKLHGNTELLETAAETLHDYQELLKTATIELSTLDDELRKLQVQLSTAESALDAGPQELLRRRDELDNSLAALEDKLTGLNTALSTARTDAAVAEQILDGHEKNRATAEEARDLALRRLWITVDSGFMEPLALPGPQRQTVQAARELAATIRREITLTAQAADEDRRWRKCYDELQTLRQRLLPDRDAQVEEFDSDEHAVQQVRVLADQAAGWQRPDLAADALAARAQEQHQTFDAEQQRVLTTLLGSTFIEHLKDRLDYTRTTFEHINQQLERHPTRQGHLVRVGWQADPADADARAVIDALDQGFAELTSDRQNMVRSFLARKIDEARSESESEGVADWKAELSQALDYRGWLRLFLEYRPGSGSRFAPFDAAKHGAKSGGEKVVLLSQPLFAAAVVAFDAAGPLAPRWVWLDEAMTGVDEHIKASFMGLTVDFQLDVMLTAHDEWCRYSTVPAVAIYDLAREQHIAGVDILPYLWRGNTLTKVDVDRLGISQTNEAELEVGLFASD